MHRTFCLQFCPMSSVRLIHVKPCAMVGGGKLFCVPRGVSVRRQGPPFWACPVSQARFGQQPNGCVSSERRRDVCDWWRRVAANGGRKQRDGSPSAARCVNVKSGMADSGIQFLQNQSFVASGTPSGKKPPSVRHSSDPCTALFIIVARWKTTSGGPVPGVPTVTPFEQDPS